MKYTELELQVIKAFRNSMNYDTLEANLNDNCTCLDVKELAQITGQTVKTIKGVVGSLTKKNLILVEEYNLGETCLMVTNEGIKAYFELFENNNGEANKEDNTMAQEMTREEKLWTMTGKTLLGVAEKLGIKTSKSTLKQGKEKLIAKILEAENAANDEWEKEANNEKAARDQKQAENDKIAENAVNKPEKKQPKTKDQDQPKTESKSAGRGALIEYDGRSQNICKWAEELGISANTLYGRIYHLGWTVEKAFTTPGRNK